MASIPVLALAVMSAVLILSAAPAEAAFVVTKGSDPEMVRKDQVAVAVVEVVAERVNEARKRKGFLLHRHMDLKVIRHVHGPRPGVQGLTEVPFSPGFNSAWPPIAGSLRGRRFLMAWRRGKPCGLGSTLSFGPRLQLPILVTGPKDPWVEAVAAFLALPRQSAPEKDRVVLETAFRQTGRPRLTLLADQALLERVPSHGHSPWRLLGLLEVLDSSAGADPLLGWAILSDLLKLPAITTAQAYARSWGDRAMPSGLWFGEYRLRLVTRLAAMAVDPAAETNLRRLSLMLLSRAPAFLAIPRDPVDARVEEAVKRVTRDSRVEVRRSALVALRALSRARAKQRRAPGGS